jgi:uncharacterized protein (TIGR03435 family)
VQATGPLAMAQAGAQVDATKLDALVKAAKFEVVSIHPADPDGHGMRIGMGPDARFVAEGVTMQRLVCMAYGLQDFQLEGAPGWFKNDRWSIQAKSESDVEELLPKLTNEQRMAVGKQMVQAMLADRFALSLRQESKKASTLGIVVDKNGPKLHQATPGDTYPNGLKEGNGAGHAGMMRFNGTQLTAQGVKLDNLASFLSGQLNQVVQNKTGLDGLYDFTLEWLRDADRPQGPQQMVGEGGSTSADGSAGTSLFTAIREQLGLKLEEQKSDVPVYVVEKAEKPTQN